MSAPKRTFKCRCVAGHEWLMVAGLRPSGRCRSGRPGLRPETAGTVPLLPVEPLQLERWVSEHNGHPFRRSESLSSLSRSVAATESRAHHVTDLTLAPHPARLETPMVSNGQRSPRTSPVPSALRRWLTSAQSSSLSSLRSRTIQSS